MALSLPPEVLTFDTKLIGEKLPVLVDPAIHDPGRYLGWSQSLGIN
jgi:hypothetical protein